MAYTKTNWQNGVTPVNADNMNKIEGGIENALAKPDAVLSSNELVGVGTNGEQIRVQLGEGLVLEGTGSPYTLKASGGGGGGASIGGGYRITSSVNSSGAKICILCGKHTYQGNSSGEEDYFGLHEVTLDDSIAYSHIFENAVMFFIVSGNKSYWTYNSSMIVDSTGAHPTELVYNKPYFFVSGGYFDYEV